MFSDRANNAVIVTRRLCVPMQNTYVVLFMNTSFLYVQHERVRDNLEDCQNNFTTAAVDDNNEYKGVRRNINHRRGDAESKSQKLLLKTLALTY